MEPRPPRRPLWPGVAPFVAAALRRKRSLAAEAPRLLRRLRPPPLVEGVEHIPTDQPCIVVANHFERPGLWVAWVVLALSAAVASRSAGRREIHWLLQSELTEHRYLGIPLPRWISRFAIRQMANVYDFVILPLGEDRVAGRGAAIREAAAWLRHDSVGLFPEGYTSHALIEARPGSGTLIALLSRGRVPVLPAGAYECDRRLVVRFGPPFTVAARRGDRQAEDARIRDEVMLAIGRLLPERLWGYYHDRLAADRALPPV